MDYYNLARGLHILAVIAWMAGMLFLPRLFAYDAEQNAKPEPLRGEMQALLRTWQASRRDAQLKTLLGEVLPKRFAQRLCEHWITSKPLRQYNAPELRGIADLLSSWPLVASGTEGYRTAEVTLGGVDTDGLSSSTMMSKHVPGLYFIGEVVDVTGWLGGYNFQWAWASGHAAGQALCG